ncbi:MAG TPA: sugar phosphate isomerase/epimerase, partial [Acidimicrobiales bacterium]|nr:sugar phosphate isomerase/epimerase [Acidimicrobiales bacterium]
MREYTAGMWVYGPIVDRYATDGYREPIGTLELIELAASSGVVGLDLNYPFPEAELALSEVREALQRCGLSAVCVTPAIYTRRFARGAFTNPDPSVRAAAHDLVASSVEVARGLGAG